jgi:integrase
MVRLAVADVDLANRLLIVRPGKGDKARVVGFDAATGAAIDRYKRTRARHRLALRPDNALDEPSVARHHHRRSLRLLHRSVETAADPARSVDKTESVPFTNVVSDDIGPVCFGRTTAKMITTPTRSGAAQTTS